MKKTAPKDTQIKKSFFETHSQYLIAAILLAVTFVAFYQTLGHDFIRFYDDDEYVVKNPMVSAGLTKEGIVWAFTKSHSANWHPLTWMSHMLDCRLYKLNPMGHHLTSLLFHIANVLLLFWVLTLMTRSLWRSGFVAALFAIHPLHVESVAWVAERKDVLSTFFWILTMLAYVWYVRRPGIGRYLLVALAFVMGLMSKPMLVTLPFALLLLDYWPLGRLRSGNARKAVLEKAPLWGLSIASSIITYAVQQKAGAVAMLGQFPVAVRIGNALVAYVGYIVKMLWPSGLAFYYPRSGNPLAAWQVVGAIIVLVCISVFVIRAARKRPYLAMGWLWYLGTLIPVIGLIQVGSHAMADRYTYVPLIGLFIIVAWGVPEFLARRKPKEAPLLAILAVIVIVVLTVCTWIQVGYWKDGVTLYEHALACTTNNAMTHNNLGNVLFEQNEFAKAAEHFSAALEIDPKMAEARNNLGNALVKMGRVEEGIAQYREALRLMPNDTQAHFNLGIVFSNQGKLDEAIAEYTEALRLKPDNPGGYNNLGNVYARLGRFDDAIAHYREVIRLQPNSPDTYNNMGNALAAQGKVEEAIRSYSDAIRMNPNQVDAHFNLAIAYSRLNRNDEAMQEYRAVIRIRPDHAGARMNLATLLYLRGDYAEAWREIQECRNHGYAPDPRFVEVLAAKMPEPRN